MLLSGSGSSRGIGVSGAGHSQDELPGDSGQTPNSRVTGFLLGSVPLRDTFLLPLASSWEQISCGSTPEQIPVLLSPLECLIKLTYELCEFKSFLAAADKSWVRFSAS